MTFRILRHGLLLFGDAFGEAFVRRILSLLGVWFGLAA